MRSQFWSRLDNNIERRRFPEGRLLPTGIGKALRDAAGMVAVPEPTTALLLGLGLMGLSMRRRGAI